MVAAASSLSAYWRLTTIIDVQKITAWGESGFPARFLVDTFRWVRNGQRSESFLITRAVIRAGRNLPVYWVRAADPALGGSVGDRPASRHMSRRMNQ